LEATILAGVIQHRDGLSGNGCRGLPQGDLLPARISVSVDDDGPAFGGHRTAVGILAGRSPQQRLAFFFAAFSIWDLFYYVFLKLFLHWPDSLLTWDILFLIPIPWVGPVLTPCLISLTLLLLAAVLYYRDLQRTEHRISLLEWALFFIGSQVVILSWTWDYFLHRLDSDSPNEALIIFSNYIPSAYPWWMFVIGEGLLLLGIFHFWKRTKE